MNDNIELNEGHAIEALDRACVAMEHFYIFVAEHPYIEQNEKLKELAEKVSNTMYEMYNAVSMECNKDENMVKREIL